jgi:hypothetical protein
MGDFYKNSNKRLKTDTSQPEIDAAENLRSLKKVQAPGLDKLLLAIAMSEEIAPPALSRNSSVTSFFSATSPSPTLSRDSSYSYSQSDLPIPDDVREGISQLTEEDLDEIKRQLEERNKPCVLAKKEEVLDKKDPVLAENDAVLIELDYLIDKLFAMLKDGKNGCIFISNILNKIFQIFKCGMGVANTIFESKLYLRLFIIISTIGYFSNDTCAESINVIGAAIFNIMDLILRNASPENYAKLQAIFTCISNIMKFIFEIATLIGEHGLIIIQYVKTILNVLGELPADALKSALENLQMITDLMKQLNLKADDIAKILHMLTSLGLKGEDMAKMLASILQILIEMQHAGTGAVASTIINRLTGSLGGVASQAAITAIATTMATAMSNVPRIGNGNGGGKRNKKTRKNKKKTVNKRRKQQRKSKRR